MGDRSLITVATFGSPAEATLARGRLEEQGIAAFLQGAETGTTLWHVGTALGGVKLQVARSDLARAKELLESEEAPSSVGPWTCATCGSQVDEGFEVCWSCGATFDAQPEAAREPGPAAAEVAPPESEAVQPSAPESSREQAEELLARAWRASLIGIVLFPGLTHLYSATLLARYHQIRSDLARSDPRATAAALINIVMVGIAAMVFVWLFAARR